MHSCRIEAAPPLRADVVSARALARLGDLLAMAERFTAPSTVCLFPKGRNAAAELAEARGRWRMDVAVHPSLSDPEASIIVLREVRRA